MSEARYIYGSYRSLHLAELALEDMYASGEVFAAERPLIEYIHGRWRITLPC